MSHFSNIRSSKPLKYDFDFKHSKQGRRSAILPDNVRLFDGELSERDDKGFYHYDIGLEEFNLFHKHKDIVMKRFVDSIMQLLNDNESKGEILIIETTWNYITYTDDQLFIECAYKNLTPELLIAFFELKSCDHKKLTVRY